MTDHLPECRWPRYMVVCVGCGRQQMDRPVQMTPQAYGTPPTGAEWTEAIVKALHLGYLDALDDVQDQLREMGQVWCNAHGSHVSRNDVHLMLDKLRKP